MKDGHGVSKGDLACLKSKLSASRLRYCTPDMRVMLGDVQMRFRGEVTDKNASRAGADDSPESRSAKSHCRED